jgi:hypothetical protein
VNKLPLLRLFFVCCFCAAAPAFARGSAATFAELGDNTFTATRQAKTAFNRDVDQLTAEAKQDAAAYCAKLGKQLKVTGIDVDKPKFSLGYVSVKVTFKALESGDPALSANDTVVVTDVRKKTAATTTTVTYNPTTDLYNDLMKLDDLRKKGILTDEEFQAEKKKVLSRSK